MTDISKVREDDSLLLKISYNKKSFVLTMYIRK